ncbi:MAG: cytochrome c3 family protein [Candidatus Nitrospinota bacterium M3_3B_026]
MSGKVLKGLAVLLLLAPVLARAAGWDSGSRASNTDSIVNTRHNLSLSFAAGQGSIWQMDNYRNQYGEVCVYCHTPHGANSQLDAPLWNRTKKNNTYTLYNIPLQSGQSPTQPGVSSLTCLSCHDGTTAIDSIINMPGSGRYNASQETTQNDGFLYSWPGASGNHFPLGPPGTGFGTTCRDACHNPGGPPGAPDFTAFALTKDLRDDHPVGVNLPNTSLYDFNAPTATDGTLQFFDTDGDGRADPDEVRFYDTGDGYEVECASCHDPHGVDGGGGALIPSFLRVNNNNASSLCLTCHDK